VGAISLSPHSTPLDLQKPCKRGTLWCAEKSSMSLFGEHRNAERSDSALSTDVFFHPLCFLSNPSSAMKRFSQFYQGGSGKKSNTRFRR
jgi:hypothetical protein